MKTFNVEYVITKIDTNTDNWKTLYKQKMGKFTYQTIEQVINMFLDRGFKGEIENFGDSAYLILYVQEIDNITRIEGSLNIYDDSR